MPSEGQRRPERAISVSSRRGWGPAASEKNMQKSEKVGVVVSNKMQKSIVVAVEWQVRHGLYGKTERRTSKFMVHDENNDAKPGDMVETVETRPQSRRKRWALKRVLPQAVEA